MSSPWPTIVERYREPLTARDGNEGFLQACEAIGALAEHICTTQLGNVLFGTTSMFDLCIQPADLPLLHAPHLRIAPLPSGLVSFRYVDTAIEARQWSRDVAVGGVVAQLHRFLEQLGWARAVPLPAST